MSLINQMSTLPTTSDATESIEDQCKLVCMIIRATPAPSETTFYTSPELPLQVGKIVYAAGSEIPRHSHPSTTRSISGRPEVLLVQEGRMTVDIYRDDQSILCSRELRAGDVILFFGGGHGFRLLENTVLLEIKQGPFLGEQDKKRF